MKRRAVTLADRAMIDRACRSIALARDDLRRAGARNAATYAARALKSAEGARRHADNVWHRQMTP